MGKFTKELSIIKYNLNPKICPQCSTSLLYQKRYRIFCSIKCANISLNKGKRKDLSLINWQEIQTKHNEGLLWSEIPQHYGFGMIILRRAEKKGLIKKIKRYHKWTDKEKKIQSKKRTKYLCDNPGKHPWKKHTKFLSAPCEKLKQKLKENTINFAEEYKPLRDRHFSIDIAFPDKKIGIEVNGNQHYNRDGTLSEYYKNRKKIIEKNGWKIFDVHYSKVFDDNFVSEFIKKIKQDYSLEDIDYTFFIKSKKKKRTREDYFDDIKNKAAIRNKPLINLVVNSDIDFSKFGWVKKVSAIIEVKEQKVNKWMKRYMLDFYNEKCFKKYKIGSMQLDKVRLVDESNIDFTQKGWSGKLSKLINRKNSSYWFKKYMPNLYSIRYTQR